MGKREGTPRLLTLEEIARQMDGDQKRCYTLARDTLVRVELADFIAWRNAIRAHIKLDNDEVDEFNAGFACEQAGGSENDEPSETPHDQWLCGFAWARYLRNRRAGARPSPALKEIVERMRAAAEHTRAHATHWRQPYQRFCLEIARTENEWADEIERAASLTAEQREAIEVALKWLPSPIDIADYNDAAAANKRISLLRALLEGPTQEAER